MEHVVFYQSTQGTPAFRRMASIEDAVSFAEHLRNVEGVTDFSVYSLAPVSLKLRAYYHVEVSDNARQGARSTQTEPEAAAPSRYDIPPEQPVADDVTIDASAFRSAAATEMPAEPAAAAASASELPSADADPAPEPLASTGTPFVTAPIASAPPATFVKDGPGLGTDQEVSGAPGSLPPIDPNVVDPTVEEVVPVPPGRRSMGFFARS